MEPIYLRLSIHDECNLRCTYCRPARDHKISKRREALSTDQLVELVGLIDSVAPVRKLRLTGGEPLLRSDAVELVASMRGLLPEAELCLTTNGSRLAVLAEGLKRAGLDRLNVSLDTVDPVVYERLTRGGDLEKVLSGLKAARLVGFSRTKLNAVLMQSLNGSGLENLVRMARELADEIRFIELMPISVAAGLHRHEYLSAARAVSEIEQAFGPAEPQPASGTAQNYTIQVDGHPLGMGIIPSVSEPFCSGCDRLRLDSRGKLFACLRHPDWLDLGTPLREGQAELVRERVTKVLDAKCAPEFIWPGREMSSIGG